MRNLILTAMLAMASLFGMAAQADDYTAGKEYVELSSPVPVSQPGKIEVVELFWYGCPHCYAFEPTIVPWSEKLPADRRWSGGNPQAGRLPDRERARSGQEVGKVIRHVAPLAA